MKVNLVFLFMLGTAQAIQWPNRIKRCLKNEPQMDKCLMSAAKHAIPRLAKGIAEIGLKPLDPLTGANFSLGGDTGPVSLRVSNNHVTISGPSKLQLKKITFNEKLSQLEVLAFHKLLRMNGTFNANGRIIVFPINTRGFFNFDFREVQAIHTVKIKRNSQEKLTGRSVTFTVTKLGRVVVNLKDRNNVINNSLNKLVNDNWKVISNAMIPSMEAAIEKIYGRALSPLFENFPVDDIFPDT